MSDIDTASGGDDGALPITVIEANDAKPIYSLQDAANSIVDTRAKNEARKNDEPASAAKEPAAAEPPKLADEASAAPEKVPGETTEEADPADLPSIEPPRSWTKEDKELFTGLPRETQERLAERERSRESDFLRRQNESAETLKGLTAKEQAAEQARQQYESALPALLQTLNDQQQGEFSDIKTMADVKKLADEDWPRYAKWDAQQKQIAAVNQEVRAAQERQAQVDSAQWTDFASKEDKRLIERAPELADTSKAKKIADSAVSLLKDIGFTEQELAESWNGKQKVSLRDHRIQLLILDGVKYRDAQQAKKAAVVKTVPQVQRPGVASQKGSSADDLIASLDAKFKQTGNWKDAAELHSARVAARR